MSEELVKHEDTTPVLATPQTPAEKLVVASSELADLERQAIELANGGQVGETSQSTDVVAHRAADPVAAKAQLAAKAATAKKLSVAINAKKAEMERMMQAEMDRIRGMVAPLEKMMKKIEKSIFTINLYLGRDEEIVLLQDGASAPADQTLTLRQMVLFMDEECAVAAEEGGITATDIGSFDQWLLENPAHLDQVLPETKGIVALRVRRRPHRNDAEFNKQTYWLIRNGERVYRTVTQLEIGDRILPNINEFQQLFSRVDSKGYRVALLPGSYEWERAQEGAEDLQQQYMRVGLILEGLLHRTPIFHPLPDNGISFLDSECVMDGRIRYITDAEALLGTGNESFEQWRYRLSQKLTVGMRVIIGPGLDQFSSNYHGRESNSRLTPGGAIHPNHGDVFTIESVKGNETFIIRYREGKRWVNSGGWYGGENREPKRRASCKLLATDSFVLPFDLADVESMERFLQNRSDRHHYEEMFPILQAAIAAKKNEAELEAPFAEMLSGVLARENDVSVDTARQAVPELIQWWKLKNRYHRPLVAAAHQDAVVDKNAAGEDHEPKAVRMIMAEYAARLKDERRGFDEGIVALLRADHPQALVIARPRKAGYIVVEAASPTVDVYVHETEYTATGKLKNKSEWIQPGITRPKTWMIIDKDERWDQWNFTANENEYLREPELDALRETVIANGKSNNALAVAWSDDGQRFTTWSIKSDVKLSPQAPLTQGPKALEIEASDYGWTRNKSGAVTLRGSGHPGREKIRKSGKSNVEKPWEKLKWMGSYDSFDPSKPEYNVIWKDDKAIAKLEKQLDEYAKALEEQYHLSVQASQLTDSVQRVWEELTWANERARFDEDFGDEELWEAHKKTKEQALRFPFNLREGQGSFNRNNSLWDAIGHHVETGQDVEGWTVSQVIESANRQFKAALTSHWDTEFKAPEELAGYVLSKREPGQPEGSNEKRDNWSRDRR